MDGQQFDQFTKAFATGSSRRSILRGIGGGLLALVTGAVAEGKVDAARRCKGSGGVCNPRKQRECCTGATCIKGKCCQNDHVCGTGATPYCADLENDPSNCGGCGVACGAGQDCIDGVCRVQCPSSCFDLGCCDRCFLEVNPSTGEPQGTDPFCCEESMVCPSLSGEAAEDTCCRADQVCLNGVCCCDGCEGTVDCGGVCCPATSCCNGACCSEGKVCRGGACLPDDDACSVDADCPLLGETCVGGVCCSPDRVCMVGEDPDSRVPVCCPYGEYCDFDICCPVGNKCNSYRPIRVRF